MNKLVLFGSLLALGIVAFSADSASAQYITPFGGVGAYNTYSGYSGAVTPIANGGVIQTQLYSSPYLGNTYGYTSYVNPYVASYVNRYSTSRYYPNYFSGYRSNWNYSGFGYRNFGYGGYGFGNYGYGGFGFTFGRHHR